MPAADLVQLEASAGRRGVRPHRAANGTSSRSGRAWGGRSASIRPRSPALPLPSDPFPDVAPEEVPPGPGAQGFIELALRQPGRPGGRAAAGDRGSTFSARPPRTPCSRSSTWSSRPATRGSSGGGGVAGFFAPLFRNVPGASTVLSLALSWPTLNQRARGALLQADAARRQNALAVDLLAKGIGADVPAALDAVGRDALQLAKAREAVGLFERTVVNEEKKLKGGTSTLLDLITQRDRLIAARQTEVAAELALALLAARASGSRPGRCWGAGRTGGGGRALAPDHPPLSTGGGAMILSTIFRKVSLEGSPPPSSSTRWCRSPIPRGGSPSPGSAPSSSAAIGWGIFGSIPTEAQGDGILLRQGGSPTWSPTPPARSRRCWSASAT